jgi:AcrR family transcriptional regulator
MAKQPNRKRTPGADDGYPGEAGASGATAGSSAPPPAAPSGAPGDRIIDALMALAAERDWDEIEIPEIAARADVTLAEFRDAFPSKGAILAGLSRRIDKAVLEVSTEDLADESMKERLFDVLMRRIDALTPYRDALRRISPAMRRDPLSLAAMNQLAVNSMRFMLAAAGIDTSDALGAVRVQGAVLVWARTLETWLDDDDPGLARTMATLDRELRRGANVMRGIGDLCRLAAPFRAVLERVADGRRRFRERPRASRDRDYPEDEAGAAAI